MAISSELLIEHVKKHEVMFNTTHPDYKNLRLKNKLWEKIAKEMDMEGKGGEELKKRWKSLRDCYTKYLRAHNLSGFTAKGSRGYKTWPWAKEMEWFQPFMVCASEPNTNSEETKTPEDVNREEQSLNGELNEDINMEFVKSEFRNDDRNETYTRKRRKVVTSPSTSMDQIVTSPTQQYDTAQTYNDIDLIFQGYAASVKKLPPKSQTMVKFKVAEIIMKAELSEYEDA
ncbi:uncharacterized protein LOC123680831 [Harmonia axyridis]|uniref:uncharacterized protein LOC123680831 n=1 Tax=Harmonia axyridis TaxID=115357 RepID=UPI001E278928|nr:uncharacterized protein LOC123680831 [Harmonia axyridis]